MTFGKLWERALGPTGNKALDDLRSSLVNELLDFRERASKLLSLIAEDMKGYTVHDITHIDALWEIAETIAGEYYPLNPAEAFVYGGAALLHDAGMTLAAYERGAKSLSEYPEWTDNFAHAKSVRGLDRSSDDSLANDTSFISFVITATLRDLHAKKAAALLQHKWYIPGSADPEFLLEKSDLREHFGDTIGKIAASHHWDTRKVLAELGSPLGAFARHPSDWTVDRVKIALLLRCADATQIDARRAPRLLFAMTQPLGVSREHWTFQRKLAKPQVKDNKILFTSNSAFTATESDAWQLCWDAISLADKELQQAREIHRQRSISEFQVTGIHGAHSPTQLAQFVEVVGWTPLLADIRVTDVARLAKTLGGRDLYSQEFTPLRELLQNAADAIEARVHADPSFSLDQGRIDVVLGDVSSNGDMLVRVEDNGLGMSEQVITGPLIDFGNSFWRSQNLREEYPGLQARLSEPRGRYGIGFFSIFMWSEEVKVVSRAFHEGLEATRVLEFRGGLNRRPILRPAAPEERSARISTIVSVRIGRNTISRIFDRDFNRANRRFPFRYFPVRFSTWSELVSLLTALLNIDVFVTEDGNRRRVILPDWKTAPSDQFIRFFSGFVGPLFGEEDDDMAHRIIESLKADQLSFVKINGEIIGRAALMSKSGQPRRQGWICMYEKGIFIQMGSEENVFGAMESRATTATRETAERPLICRNEEWLSEQTSRVFLGADHIGHRLAAQRALVVAETYNRDEPLVIQNRKIRSIAEALDWIAFRRRVVLIFDSSAHDERFTMFVAENLSVIVGDDIDADRLYFLVSLPGEYTEHFDPDKVIIEKPETAFAKLLREIKSALGDSITVDREIIRRDEYTARRRLIMTITGVTGNTYNA